MYEYIPKPDRRLSLALILLLFAAAASCFIPVWAAFAAVLRAVGTLSALAAIMLTHRFLLTGYAYAVESAEHGADFTVTELRGSRRGRAVCKTVCCVKAAGGRLERYGAASKAACRKAGIRLVNYCVEPFPGESYIFIPAEALRAAADPDFAYREELTAVRFQPDSRLLEILGGGQKDSFGELS